MCFLRTVFWTPLGARSTGSAFLSLIPVVGSPRGVALPGHGPLSCLWLGGSLGLTLRWRTRSEVERGEVFWWEAGWGGRWVLSCIWRAGTPPVSLKRGRSWSGHPGRLSPPALSPAGVGKSSLLLRFADNTFSGECAPGVLLGVWVLNPFPWHRYTLVSASPDGRGAWRVG